MNVFKDLLHTLPDGIVLDVATGQGKFLLEVSEDLAPGSLCIGVDLRREGFPRGDSLKACSSFSFAQMEACRLAAAPDSFDLVMVSNSLHHLHKPRESLLEMKRVLRPGGVFLVREMYRDFQEGARRMHVDMHHWWAKVDQLRGVPHFETFTRAELAAMLGSLGLLDLRLVDVDENDTPADDPGTLQALEQVLNDYLGFLHSHPGGATLVEEGESLRKRLQQEGFLSATKLEAAGIKRR